MADPTTSVLDQQQGSLANWDSTTLTRFIQDILTRNPPSFLPIVSADELVVNSSLVVKDKVSFFGQTFKMVGGTGQPAFQNSWLNWGSPNAAASFVKSPDGWVRLHGLVKNLTNPLTLPSTIFTLPPGFRPEATCVFHTIGLNAIARIDIDATGVVSVVTPTLNTAPWVSLEMITFKAV